MDEYQINFALGKASVMLLSSYIYTGGLVYHVEDIRTGHQDFVGVEFINPKPPTGDE